MSEYPASAAPEPRALTGAPPPQPTASAPTPDALPYPGVPGPVPMAPSDEKTWSTLSHLSWLVGSLVVAPFLGPLVLFLVLKDRGPFVRHHTAEALNFQLSLLVYGLGVTVVGGLVSLLTLGTLAPLWALAGGALLVAGAVLTVLAAVGSSRGEWYRYPLTIRFVR